MELVGATIVGIVTVQVLLALLGQTQRLSQAKQQRRLSNELLQQRIDAAKALRVQREQTQFFWNGYRKFVVQLKSIEAENVCSFYLVPHDEKALPQFQPGQYLTFRLNLPGQAKSVVRCYSLSDVPHASYYRVTIKRVQAPHDNPDAPPGLVSNYFLDHVTEGDILDIEAPRGNFTLHPGQVRPIVLLAGGVGITPLLSMLGSIAENQPDRELWLFYGVRNGREHAFKDVLDDLRQRHHSIRIINCYSQRLDDDVEGRDYDYAECISIPLLKQVLDSNNYDFYVCGPPPMMASLIDGLREWKVPKDRVHSESFGPASGKAIASARDDKPSKGAPPKAKKPKAATNVSFERSAKTVPWEDSFGNLLDFGLKNNIPIDSGCRAGSCKSCVVAIKSGGVTYVSEPGVETDKGTCLTCISVPANEEDLVLDV